MNARRFLGLAALTFGVNGCAEHHYSPSTTELATVKSAEYHSAYTSMVGKVMMFHSARCLVTYAVLEDSATLDATGFEAKSWCETHPVGTQRRLVVARDYLVENKGHDSTFVGYQAIRETDDPLLSDVLKRKP